MISENTPASRTRRAISCVYWLPKSRMRTSSRGIGGSSGGGLACKNAGDGTQPDRRNQAEEHRACVARERRPIRDLHEAEIERVLRLVPARPRPERTREVIEE